MSDAETAARVGTMVDANVHLWDQATNPVFWLSDRTMLVDMLGDYRSLPDRYVLDDYVRATALFDIGGLIWFDPGIVDSVAAIDWVHRQDRDGLVVGIVTLGLSACARLRRLRGAGRRRRAATSVRVRLVPGF